MKTPIEAIIDMVKNTPNEVITKHNLLHMLENMLPTEREHLESMTDVPNNALKHFGVRGFSGKELFERRYRGIVQNGELI